MTTPTTAELRHFLFFFFMVQDTCPTLLFLRTAQSTFHSLVWCGASHIRASPLFFFFLNLFLARDAIRTISSHPIPSPGVVVLLL